MFARLAVLAGFMALVALVALALPGEGTRASGATIVVNTTEDVPGDAVCNDGDCSLRAAITIAQPGDTIAFNIVPPVVCIGICIIAPTTPLPPISDAGLTIDGFTQPGAVANSASPGEATDAVWIVTLSGLSCGNCSGLVIAADAVTIKGLAVIGWGDSGVDLTRHVTEDAVISGNLIGISPFVLPYSVDVGNARGVEIAEGSGHRVGGVEPADRNVISGNDNAGVHILGSQSAPSTGHVIAGNYMGVRPDGFQLPYRIGPAPDFEQLSPTQLSGVVITGGAENLVGGDTPGERNVVSGFPLDGIRLIGSAADNTVSGNFVGTNAFGNQGPGNRSGVSVSGALGGNVVGGDEPGERNLISTNESHGVLVSTSDGTTVSGNYIGTDVSGFFGIGNGGSGVYIRDSDDVVVGGNTQDERNVIATSAVAGVEIERVNLPTTNNIVTGNYIGIRANGDGALAAAGQVGIAITGGAVGNRIGGRAPGERNYIAGLEAASVSLEASETVVEGNSIGLDVQGDPATSDIGVYINGSYNTIGGTLPGAGNEIAHHDGNGVVVEPEDRDGPNNGNRILGNSIHDNGLLGIDLKEGVQADGLVTANDADDGDDGGNNLQNFPVIAEAKSGSLFVTGSLNSTPDSQFRIEFFANETCDASGNGEGALYAGFENVETNNQGDTAIGHIGSASVPVGSFLTATATNLGTGDSSEYSECVLVEEAPPTPTPAPTPTVGPTTTAPTGSATPTSSPSSGLRQGDIDCDGDVDEQDGLYLLEVEAALEGGEQPIPCPDVGEDEPQSGFPWGDVNCDGDVDTLDALYVLAHVAGVELEQATPSCFSLGSAMI